MGKITKNYIYNLLYQTFIMIVPLVTAPYLSRVLGAEGTGTYSYVHSMTSIICTIVMLGIYSYGNRQIAYVRDNKESITQIFWQIISARIIIAVIGSLIYFVVVVSINRYITMFAIYYTYLLAYFIDCTWLYVGVEDMKWAVIKNTLTKALAVIGIFAFVRSKADVAIYILIQGVSVLISNTLAYTQIRRYVGKPHLDFRHIKQDLQGSIYLFLPSVATTIYLQCDKIMIELMTGATNEVSYYDYAEKIVTIPLTFITVLSTVMMPRIANEFKKNNQKSISELINKAANFSMFLAFPMVLGLMAVADKLVPWYLGDNFYPTINAIIIISPIIVMNTLTGISGNQYFTATNQIGILVKSQLTAVVGNIIINALLIPNYGFYGAAFATLITNAVCVIIQYYYLIRQIKLPGLLKSSMKYAIISILMFIMIRYISSDLPASPMTNVIQVFVGFVFYIFFCSITKDKQIAFLYHKLRCFFER